jgi:hypothetical protein
MLSPTKLRQIPLLVSLIALTVRASTFVVKPLDNLGCSKSYYYDTTLYICRPCGNNAV